MKSHNLFVSDLGVFSNECCDSLACRAASKRNSKPEPFQTWMCTRLRSLLGPLDLGTEKNVPPTEALKKCLSFNEQTLIYLGNLMPCPKLKGNPTHVENWKPPIVVFSNFTESEANPRWSEDGLKV